MGVLYKVIFMNTAHIPPAPTAPSPFATPAADSAKDSKSIAFSVMALVVMFVLPMTVPVFDISADWAPFAVLAASAEIAIAFAAKGRKHATTKASEALAKWTSIFGIALGLFWAVVFIFG